MTDPGYLAFKFSLAQLAISVKLATGCDTSLALAATAEALENVDAEKGREEVTYLAMYDYAVNKVKKAS